MQPLRSDRGRRGRSFGLTRGRVEAFSDGVFAIAATLLILNVQVPPDTRSGLLRALFDLWPEYAAYGASFLTIGIMWLNHHSLLSRVARVDRGVVLLNLGLLMVVAFVPFPTEVLGRRIASGSDAQVAAAFYSLSNFLIAIGFSALYVYVVRHPELLASGVEVSDLRRAMPWFTIGLGAYLACVPLAFISPTAVVVVIAVAAIYYAFERVPAPRDVGTGGEP